MDKILEDVDYMWGDGGGGWYADYVLGSPVARHWCMEELECVQELVMRKGYKWSIREA